VRLRQECVYLAVLLDVHSRRVIGWALERYLNTGLCHQALEMVLACSEVKAGLMHHLDRGVQYASKGYTDTLESGYPYQHEPLWQSL
jgi:putative transposase